MARNNAMNPNETRADENRVIYARLAYGNFIVSHDGEAWFDADPVSFDTEVPSAGYYYAANKNCDWSGPFKTLDAARDSWLSR